MHAAARIALLSVIPLGLAWGQPAAPPPVPPEAAPEGARPAGPAGERGWRREGGLQQPAAAFMERLRQERPELHERLTRLYQEDRQGFFQEIRNLMRERGLQVPEGQGTGGRGRRDSPEEQKCLELSRLYRDAKQPAEQERLKTELAEAVSVAFSARLRSSQERVARLEKQLAEFRENLARLETNREKICAERLEELTRPTELRWDGNW